jgi:processive 1,2-diacylglycerol beta-glucosyltransferase
MPRALQTRPPRVLILTASIGEGHDRPARALTEQLRAERPGIDVTTVDAMPAMGRTVALVGEGAPGVVFYRFTWLWDLGFWAFARLAPTRRATQALLTRLAGPGLLRLVEERAPDVVVSVIPHATEVLGRLRAAGRLQVPLVAAITDLAALDYWASPGADLHLITHPESAEEVRRVAGPDARVQWVHGLSAADFLRPPAPRAARAALGLPAEGGIVVVSGGGWGVGDVEGGVACALGVDGVAQAVALCGRNEQLAARLRERFAGEARVRVEGFTERMPDWLAAADVLVHSTGGLTVLEALMSGCRPISYGWGRGHVRLHNAAFRRHGLAEVARTADELRAAIADALRAGRSDPSGFAELPSAASAVLGLADAR